MLCAAVACLLLLTSSPANRISAEEVTTLTAEEQTTAAYTTLKYGTKDSAAVKALQKRLKELGYVTCSATGGYYNETAAGVKAFLAACGMEGDGKTATPDMQAILFSDSAPVCGESYHPSTPAPEDTAAPDPTATPAPTQAPEALTTLKYCMESAAVKRMQLRLRELGYISCSATGGYYSATVSGVKLFLAAIGMEGNGKVATIEMLEILYSDQAPAYGETYDPSTATPEPTATPAPTDTPAPTATPVVYHTLKVNMYGNDAVYAMQVRLKELGYISCSPTGGYYSATSSGVKAFLKAIGMDGDGKTATPEMQQILFSAYAPAYGEKYNPQPSDSPEPTATPEPTQDPSQSYMTLSYGENSDAVFAMQTRLREFGYLMCEPTGGYYAKTVNAVKAFLDANGLEGDGLVATPEMQQLLFATEDDTPPDYSDAQTDIILSKGSTGAQVALLIQRLTELKFYAGASVDSYTSDVVDAVKWFQNTNKLDADGVAGPKTLTKLYSDSVISAEESTTGNDEKPDEVEGTPVKPQVSKAIAADWNDEYYFGKSTGLFKVGAIATVTDVATGISYQVKRVGGYNHADVEPLTEYDTWKMFQMYNQQWSWSRRAVYVTVGGVTLAGSANGYPHPDDHIADNGMDGHTCIHFSGSMTHGSEKVDPDHQKAVEQAANADPNKVQDLIDAQN